VGAEVVLFDMDGTLVHIPISVAQFLSNVYHELGLHFTVDQISLAREKVNKWWDEEFPDRTLWTRQAFIKSNHRLLEALGVKGDLQSLSERVQSHWDNLPEETGEELYPEVITVLREVRDRGIVLGVLSGRILPMSLRSLEMHGIRKYFRHVISPETAGAPEAKRSLEMWRFALNKVGARPNEVLHVDNDYEVGVVCPRRVGIRSVLLDREGVYAHIKDCAVVHDLTGILDLL
jgi:FMN phosphatase YigB (HAD superfamily)